MKRLAAGDHLPADLSECVSNDGATIALASSAPFVLFVYPEANTPGCTRQACGFRDKYDAFKKAGVTVYGASLCDTQKQSKFIADHTLPYKLLTLTKAQLDALGMVKPSGGPLRSHIIVGADGTVAEVEYAVSPEASYERAVAFAEKLAAVPAASKEKSTKPVADTTESAPTAGAAAAASDYDDGEDDDDGGGLASLLGGDLEDDEDDEEDFEPGEEEEDFDIEDDSADESDAGPSAAKKARIDDNE
eukprot:m.133880 g.133880  ORF g.133880 m.133880 type:complete len:247 (+) comp11369_c0_seq1:60-800(+)